MIRIELFGHFECHKINQIDPYLCYYNHAHELLFNILIEVIVFQSIQSI